MITKLYCFLVILCLPFLFSCGRKHSQDEIEAALKKYDHFIQRMDADSIAMMYAEDGDLGSIAHGRDSIRKFLSTFKNVRVLFVASTSDNIQINSDTSVQTGSYKQVALIDNKDTAKLKGTFIARWIWISGEGWRIKSMTTKPDN